MRLNLLFREGRPLGAQGAPMRVVNILAFMSSPYALLNLQYSVLAMVGVGFGVCGSQVQDWPELFGRWADAWSVRQFWGRTWHQLIRRYTGDAGKALVSLFGFQRGTNASAYTQLYTAFLLSGLMHAGGDYMVTPAAFGSSIPFFVMQAVAITLEDGVIALGRRAGLRDGPAWRALGYCWVVAWFWWSVPSFVDWSLARGVGRSQALPLSLVESVGKWVGVL
ncbi:hypothetical protein EWM64_g8975 [Hericium alpestre]|uniref:Wax synthase domain-containing protein n=1 Tax=Hericium alpestre TaxID=135208 RepID=A0A4Y9ZLR7_9AGAM|nr:hypothetical protein EWM64_g8975 [Hericium alpestre]